MIAAMMSATSAKPARSGTSHGNGVTDSRISMTSTNAYSTVGRYERKNTVASKVTTPTDAKIT